MAKNNVNFPCMDTQMVDRDRIQPNPWNPNHVDATKMQLLRHSIVKNGWCFPIVVANLNENFIILDGFHRWKIAGADFLDLPAVPVVVLPYTSEADMKITTMIFNRARGVHSIEGDAEVTKSLVDTIGIAATAKNLGMKPDEILRLSLAYRPAVDTYAGTAYSQAWDAREE